jgi:ABC-type xylose transport system permease subunit
MKTTNNMISLFTVILLTFMVFCGVMYFVTDLTTLSKPYSEIMSENLSQAMLLMLISIIGIIFVTIFAQYFFERDLKEQDFVNQFFEYHLKGKS